MASIRQSNFSAGELAPSLWGRTDLARYQQGLRRCRDFLVTKQGSLVSRPGTQYLGRARGGGLGYVRLIPFVWSDAEADQNYVLELGEKYMRVWLEGQLVYKDEPVQGDELVGWWSSGTTYGLNVEVAAGPFDVNGKGHWYRSLQANNVGHDPTTSTDWWALDDEAGCVTPWSAADVGRLQYVQSGDIITVVHPGYAPQQIERLAFNDWSCSELSFDLPQPTCEPGIVAPSMPEDDTHPVRGWRYVMTELTRQPSGVITESLAKVVDGGTYETWDPAVEYPSGARVVYSNTTFRSLQGSNTNHTPGASGGIWWTADATAPHPWTISGPTEDRPVTVYCGVSNNDANRVGFRVYRGLGNVYGWVGDIDVTETDATGTFLDVGDDPDFSTAPPQGTNPFVVKNADGTVARTEFPAAVTYFEDRLVFGGTSQRPAWLFLSATGDYLNFDQRLVPVADEALYFALASRKREQIRSIVGADKLFVVTGASVWAVGGSQGPITFDSVDARVRDNAGSDYLAALEVKGGILWARNKLGGVRALAYDLQRGGYVGADLSMTSEHLFQGAHIIDWCYAETPNPVVWVVLNAGSLLSLTYSPNEGVWAWAAHDVGGIVSSVCSVPEGDRDAVYMAVQRTDGTPCIERFSGEYYAVDISDPLAWGAQLDSATRRENPGATISGLDQFADGTQLYAVVVSGAADMANGFVVGPLTVESGSVTLPRDDYEWVFVGLRFQPEIELLDLAEARTKQKMVTEVAIEVNASRGLWAGADFDHLREWRQRQVSDSYNVPSAATGLVRVPCAGTWNTGGRAVLRQVDPLPLEVLGVTREVQPGG